MTLQVYWHPVTFEPTRSHTHKSSRLLLETSSEICVSLRQLLFEPPKRITLLHTQLYTVIQSYTQLYTVIHIYQFSFVSSVLIPQ